MLGDRRIVDEHRDGSAAALEPGHRALRIRWRRKIDIATVAVDEARAGDRVSDLQGRVAQRPCDHVTQDWALRCRAELDHEVGDGTPRETAAGDGKGESDRHERNREDRDRLTEIPGGIPLRERPGHVDRPDLHDDTDRDGDTADQYRRGDTAADIGVGSKALQDQYQHRDPEEQDGDAEDQVTVVPDGEVGDVAVHRRSVPEVVVGASNSEQEAERAANPQQAEPPGDDHRAGRPRSTPVG